MVAWTDMIKTCNLLGPTNTLKIELADSTVRMVKEKVV